METKPLFFSLLILNGAEVQGLCLQPLTMVSSESKLVWNTVLQREPWVEGTWKQCWEVVVKLSVLVYTWIPQQLCCLRKRSPSPGKTQLPYPEGYYSPHSPSAILLLPPHIFPFYVVCLVFFFVLFCVFFSFYFFFFSHLESKLLLKRQQHTQTQRVSETGCTA